MKKNKKRYKYKKWNKTKSLKATRNKRKRKLFDPNRNAPQRPKRKKIISNIKPPIMAPPDFRLLVKTEECLKVFSKMRNPLYQSKINKHKYVFLDLSNVITIDYSSISVLMALFDDLKKIGLGIRGNFPLNSNVQEYIQESGLLNQMYDEKGVRFKKSEKSDELVFESGKKKFTREDNIRVSKIVSKSFKHITGRDSYFKPLRTILLEICANTIEWSDSYQKQWTLGVKYDNESVIFTLTDVGNGILKTLHRKFRTEIYEKIFTSDIKVLSYAFDRKYGSKSKEINRNQGLPSIKFAHSSGIIQNLKVITNSVLLDFDDISKSKEFKKYKFKGTLYRWVVNEDCIKNLNTKNNDN